MNVVPPKSLFRLAFPKDDKPARTPPPTFLFLPIHLSNSTTEIPPVDRTCRPGTRCETIAEAIWPSRNLRAESEGSSAPLGSTASLDVRYIGESPLPCQQGFSKKCAGKVEISPNRPESGRPGWALRAWSGGGGALLVPKRRRECRAADCDAVRAGQMPAPDGTAEQVPAPERPGGDAPIGE